MDSKQLTRLKSLLKELFQLDQPELDFGLYKIMHAKSKQISDFLENDLLKEIETAFGERDGANANQLLAQAKTKLLETLGETALDSSGQLNPAFAELPAGKKYLEEVAAAEKAKEALNADAEIFDHLYRFFERYYDKGDFLSRRYYARESENRAAPYSVPYDGREVYLHWANKDQYYIKSSENFSNYSFDLKEAISTQSAEQGSAVLDLALPNELKKFTVKLHIVDAEEGEHANIKASTDQKREFIPYLDQPVELVINEDQTAELRLNFEYKVLPAGLPIDAETETRLKTTYGFSNKGDAPPHWMADVFLSALNVLPSESSESTSVVQAYVLGLSTLAATEKQTKRPLLAKYISKYIASNTMDYFIHKDLSGFLRRELDFYIKNEVMRLDDIVKADVAKARRTLEKIDCFRRIAQHLITFLAQLEDFQKKLWLKKKFVTETNYCITLDRVPEALYPAIAANEAQRIEWVKLFAIDEIQADMATVGYSVPLTVEFLKDNPFLLIDTALFDTSFKAELISLLDNFDAQCDGVLINSENFHALNLLQEKFKNKIKCVYIDPPYNTGGDGFAYKDSYQHASWLTMISDRLRAVYPLITENGVIFSSIDAIERNLLAYAMDSVFKPENRVEEIIWIQNTTKNQSPTYSTNHEYIEVYSKNLGAVKADEAMFRESKPGYADIMELIENINQNYPPVVEIETALRKLYRDHKTQIANAGNNAIDEWKGIYNYNRAEYRDAAGTFVEEKTAKALDARIWVWREDNSSMPQIKEDSQKSEFRDSDDPTFRFYSPPHPLTGKPCPAPKTGWRWPYLPHGKQKNCFSNLAEDHRIVWGDNEKKIPQTKRFLHEVETNVAKSVVHDYTDGEKEITNLFGKSRTFGGPKPTTLIARFCKHSAVLNEFVCDFFAGSGTTGHAIININREENKKRKLLLVEMGGHFDTVLKPRISKIIYSETWKDGKPISRNGISYCFKYLRFENYEDALNNLALRDDSARNVALENNADMRKEYTLKYWLDVETAGSHSLLSVEAFSDPENYVMLIKKPGSESQVPTKIDLVETFNWLIGLWVEHMAKPETFEGEFEREVDPDLPADQNTRLVCKRLRKDGAGSNWFRLIEGYTLKVPGDDTSRQKTLIVWRKLTDDAEKDNAALQYFLMDKLQISPREQTYDVIYVNGSHTLPNPVIEGENTKVRLIEEAFHNAMWSEEVR